MIRKGCAKETVAFELRRLLIEQKYEGVDLEISIV